MTETPIRDAATLVLVDRTTNEPRVLMGRRRPDLVFLPNVFVFPGGRVDDADATAPSADELLDAEAALLALPRAGHAPYCASFVRSLALAALRETFEETGLAAGVRDVTDGEPAASPAWQPYLAQGVLPRLSNLRFFLRALTPAARPRRYDTRFFLADAEEIAARGAPLDEELSEVDWFALSALDTLDVPRITRIVIAELKTALKHGLAVAPARSVPFYFEHNNVMRRTELSLSAPRS